MQSSTSALKSRASSVLMFDHRGHFCRIDVEHVGARGMQWSFTNCTRADKSRGTSGSGVNGADA
jgi:hypothetical protein